MSITIGAVTLQHLQAQPLSYDETKVIGGVTARQWEIQGLVTGTEWVALLSVYDTWRNTKINQEPAEVSKVLGATVNFSGTGYGGQTWTNIPCWFNAAPSGSQSGSMVSISFSLLDANQALQVILKELEDDAAEEEEIDYGTLTLGGVEITLLDDPDIFVDTPTVELTAGGKHYTTGPQIVTEGKTVRGTIVGTAKNTLRTWYRNTAQASPVVGQYYPVTPPVFSGINKIIGGNPVLYYEVSLSLVKIL